MEKAPLHFNLDDGVGAGRAYWTQADDGVRIRLGVWNPEAPQGTVLLMTGRTEYIEKYCGTAADMAERGFATLIIDWRGQGLSDRLTKNPMVGHVHKFSDYQRDVAAMVSAAEELNLPKPWHLLGHSMGGCIGLRAVMDGLPMASCIFSAPMWGIELSPVLRPFAWGMSWLGTHIGLGHLKSPNTSAESYVLVEPFETNKLTNDPETYQFMVDQARDLPEIGLGGPSLQWLIEALTETRDLSRQPSPKVPTLGLLGSNEDIIDAPRIHSRLEEWPNAKLELVLGGQHELLMDVPHLRKRLADAMTTFMTETNDQANDPVQHVAAGAQGS